MNDFMMALKEVKPAFGAVTETLNQYRLNDIINWGPGFVHLATTCKTLTEQVTRCQATLPTPLMMPHASVRPRCRINTAASGASASCSCETG